MQASAPRVSASLTVKTVEDPADKEVIFGTKDGRAFTASFVAGEVDRIGQRAFARDNDIPRTTVQEWLKRI